MWLINLSSFFSLLEPANYLAKPHPNFETLVLSLLWELRGMFVYCRNLFYRQGFAYDYIFDWNTLKEVSHSLPWTCSLFSSSQKKWSLDFVLFGTGQSTWQPCCHLDFLPQDTSLKGRCHEIFVLRLFCESISPMALNMLVLLFEIILRRYSFRNFSINSGIATSNNNSLASIP